MEAGTQGTRAPRAVLRVAPRAADPSPSRPASCDPSNGSHASARLGKKGSSPPPPVGGPPRPKDDIVLPTGDYQLGSPRARAEASNSLARVMEIQRQAAMMPHYPSVQWIDSFMHTRALGETSRYQQVQAPDAPFENLYNQLAETAVKNTERCQPLKCPNFPKLPNKKRTRRKSSRSGGGDPTSQGEEAPNQAATNNHEELVRLNGSCHQAYQGSQAQAHNSQQAFFGPVVAAQSLPTVSATPTSFMVYPQPAASQITYSSSGQMQNSFMGFQQQGQIMQQASFQPASSFPLSGNLHPSSFQQTGFLQQTPGQPGSLHGHQHPSVFQADGSFIPGQTLSKQMFVQQQQQQMQQQQQQQQQQIQQHQNQQQGRGRTTVPGASNFQSKGEEFIHV